MIHPLLQWKQGRPDIGSLKRELERDPECLAAWMEARISGEEPADGALHGEPPDDVFVMLKKEDQALSQQLETAWHHLWQRHSREQRPTVQNAGVLVALLRLADRWGDVKVAPLTAQLLVRLPFDDRYTHGWEPLRGMAILCLRHLSPDAPRETQEMVVSTAEDWLRSPTHYATAFGALLALARSDLADRNNLRTRWIQTYKRSNLSSRDPGADERARYDALLVTRYLGYPESAATELYDSMTGRRDVWPLSNAAITELTHVQSHPI